MLTGVSVGIGRLLDNGAEQGRAEIESEPLFPTHGPARVGRYPGSPVDGKTKGLGYFMYTGRIDQVRFELERPEDDER